MSAKDHVRKVAVERNRGLALVRQLLAGLLVLLTALAITPASAQNVACSDAVPGATSSMTVPGSGRSVMLYYPSHFSAERPAPLVLLLHGSGGTGREVFKHSRLAETADRNGFIVAAPDGGIPLAKGFVWNIPGVPAVGGRMPAASDPDDVAFLSKVVDQLVTRGCAYRRQVYGTGISGGGRMISWLACVDAERFAAISPVVGLRAGRPLVGEPTRADPATCRPSRPMPILAFAGDADKTNPIDGGGAPYWQYSMRTAEARWAELNGCTTRIDRRPIVAMVYEEGFTQCHNGADVLARVAIGGMHDWVADNQAMWTFFAAHRKSARAEAQSVSGP